MWNCCLLRRSVITHTTRRIARIAWLSERGRVRWD
jgi:hypothetical protein